MIDGNKRIRIFAPDINVPGLTGFDSGQKW